MKTLRQAKQLAQNEGAFYFFPGFIAMARTYSIMSNKSDENRYTCLGHDLRENVE